MLSHHRRRSISDARRMPDDAIVFWLQDHAGRVRRLVRNQHQRRRPLVARQPPRNLVRARHGTPTDFCQSRKYGPTLFSLGHRLQTTCRRYRFRISSLRLKAAGLPELMTESWPAFVALGMQLGLRRIGVNQVETSDLRKCDAIWTARLTARIDIPDR